MSLLTFVIVLFLYEICTNDTSIQKNNHKKKKISKLYEWIHENNWEEQFKYETSIAGMSFVEANYKYSQN